MLCMHVFDAALVLYSSSKPTVLVHIQEVRECCWFLCCETMYTNIEREESRFQHLRICVFADGLCSVGLRMTMMTTQCVQQYVKACGGMF